MQIAVVGPWIVLFVGCIAVLGAIWVTVKAPEAKRPLAMWVFGVLLVGVGAYGPAFMTDYTELLRVLTNMEQDPSPQTYSAFIDKWEAGELPESVEAAGTAMMLRRPVPGLNEMVARAAIETDEPEVRARMEEMSGDLAAQELQARVVIDQVEKGTIGHDKIFDMPETTRIRISEEFERAAPEELKARGFHPEDIQKLRDPRRWLIATTPKPHNSSASKATLS